MLELVVEYAPVEAGDAGKMPARFGREGAFCEVQEIVDHWPGDGYEYYKLRAEGAIYILRHDESANVWHLHYFNDLAHEFESASPLIEY